MENNDKECNDIFKIVHNLNDYTKIYNECYKDALDILYGITSETSSNITVEARNCKIKIYGMSEAFDGYIKECTKLFKLLNEQIEKKE